MAIAQYYVDATLGNDGNTGGIGDPWQTIQHACDTAIDDAVSNLCQINLRSNTNHTVPAGGISLAAYVVNNGALGYATRCLTFRGYSAVANDGAVAVLDGGAAANGLFLLSTYQALRLVDLTVQNFGAAAYTVGLGAYGVANNVTVINPSTVGIGTQDACLVYRCRVYGAPTSAGIYLVASNGMARNCWVKVTGAGCSYGIRTNNPGEHISNCIVDVGTYATTGIYCAGHLHYVIGNTVYANGSTAAGILSNASHGHSIVNNVVQGFSGIGGRGIYLAAGQIAIYGHNKTYSNTTPETIVGNVMVNLGHNDVLASSPFTNPAADDFSVSTLLRAAGWPTDFVGSYTDTFVDVGAAQREEPSGGGRRPRIRWHGV